jgi:hypothetical protein
MLSTYPAPSTTGNTVVVIELVGFSPLPEPVSDEEGALAIREGMLAF